MPSPAPQVPKNGKAITISGGRLSVPDQPILPFIEGDLTQFNHHQFGHSKRNVVIME